MTKDALSILMSASLLTNSKTLAKVVELGFILITSYVCIWMC